MADPKGGSSDDFFIPTVALAQPLRAMPRRFDSLDSQQLAKSLRRNINTFFHFSPPVMDVTHSAIVVGRVKRLS